MRGFFNHLWMTLKLNYRNPQAVVFGYLVPVFFLLAFGSYFYYGNPIAKRLALSGQIGQLLVICVMGGACFGMPIAFVSERERGVWRRYRLTPLPTILFVASLVIARFVIVLSAAVLELLLAKWLYGTPWPKYPVQAFAAFCLVCLAFLGLGLLIAQIANSTGAVQALGQAIFLPMILIGGVGVPLSTFGKATWVRHIAGYLPGIYAVRALDSTIVVGSSATVHEARGLLADAGSRFSLIALGFIGLAASVAAAKLFRWENEQKQRPAAKLWAVLALGVWGVVGVSAQMFPALVEPARAVAPASGHSGRPLSSHSARPGP
jgi:ABC-type multidrug transport system permease subunit